MMSDDMKVSKGLEFPVVALPGVGHTPAKGKDEQEAARVSYVAATRATQRLVIGVDGDEGLGGGYKSTVSVLQRAVASDAKRSSTFAARLHQSSHSTLCSRGTSCSLPAKDLTLAGSARLPVRYCL